MAAQWWEHGVCGVCVCAKQTCLATNIIADSMSGTMMTELCAGRTEQACVIKIHHHRFGRCGCSGYGVGAGGRWLVVVVWGWCGVRVGGCTPSGSTWRRNGGSMVYVVCVRSKRVSQKALSPIRCRSVHGCWLQNKHVETLNYRCLFEKNRSR